MERNMKMSESSGVIQSKKPPRRGLKKAIEEVLNKGLAPSSFGVAEIKKGLNSIGFVEGDDYNMNSMVHAIKDLIVDGCVAWDKNVRRNEEKTWTFKNGKGNEDE
jgi:hypothetical protein